MTLFRSLFRSGLAAGLVLMAGLPVQATEDYSRQQAEKACADRDFPTLLAAMAQSDEVARDFLAPDLTISDSKGVRQIAPQDYAGLPIIMLDYDYVIRASYEAWRDKMDFDLAYAAVELNQAQDERWRVDWQVLVEPENEGEEPVASGPSGYLLFYPNQTCWQMVQDHVDTQ